MDANPITGNKAFYLNGNSHLVLEDPGLSASYTKEAWIKIEPGQIIGNYHFIIAGTAQFPHMLAIKNNIVLAGHNALWDSTQGVRDKDSVPEGEWFHFAVTYEWTTKTMTLYRNGLEVARNTKVEQVLPLFDANQTTTLPVEGDETAKITVPLIGGGKHTILVGKYNNDSPFKGWIDEVRIWNYAREAEDIADFYAIGLPEDEREGLVSYLTFNDVDLSAHTKETPVKIKNQVNAQQEIEIHNPLGTAADFGTGYELINLRAKSLVADADPALAGVNGRIYVHVEAGYDSYEIQVYRRANGESQDVLLGKIPSNDLESYKVLANQGDLITFKVLDDNADDESFPGVISPIRVNRLERTYSLAPKLRFASKSGLTEIPGAAASNYSFDALQIAPGYIHKRAPDGGMREQIFRTLTDQDSDYDSNATWGWKRHFRVDTIRRMRAGTIEKSFFGLTGMKTELSAEVSGSGLMSGCPIGASLGLDSTKEQSYSQESVYTVSRNNYESFEITLKPQHVQLTQAFKQAVAALPTPGRNYSVASEAQIAEPGIWNAYNAFIQKWGTHYPDKVRYGGYLIAICTSSVTDILENNISAARVKASIGGQDLLPGASAGVSHTTTRTIQTKNGQKDFDLFYTGGRGTSVETWQVEDADAQPIGIDLEYLNKLFNIDYFDPEDKVTPTSLRRKAKFLHSMIKEYMSSTAVTTSPDRPMVAVYEIKPTRIKIINCDSVDDSWTRKPSATGVSELRGTIKIESGELEGMAAELIPVKQDCTNCAGNTLKPENYQDDLPTNSIIPMDGKPRYLVLLPGEDGSKKGFRLSTRLYEEDTSEWTHDRITEFENTKKTIETNKITTTPTVLDNIIATQGNAGWFIRVETEVRKLQPDELHRKFNLF